MLAGLIGHFMTITRHRMLVMKYCFRIGLYYQGLTHDLSKYTPAEFIPGVKYFQGNRSPNNAEREDKGASMAWMHHKGRNKHHYEYWTDYSAEPGQRGRLSGVIMPRRYIAEMFCDRIAASRIYNGKKYDDSFPLAYLMQGIDKNCMHEQTKKELKYLLVMLKDKGEEYTFDYVRRHYLKGHKIELKADI